MTNRGLFKKMCTMASLHDKGGSVEVNVEVNVEVEGFTFKLLDVRAHTNLKSRGRRKQTRKLRMLYRMVLNTVIESVRTLKWWYGIHD